MITNHNNVFGGSEIEVSEIAENNQTSLVWFEEKQRRQKTKVWDPLHLAISNIADKNETSPVWFEEKQ